MPLGDVTVHLATPVSTEQGTDPKDWIEGEPDEVQVAGTSFEVFYMHGPGASEENAPRGRRKIEGPTIIYEAERNDGEFVSLVAEDEVIIDPAEDEDLWQVLGGAGQVVTIDGVGIPGVLFQANGDPEPFQPPGEVLGFQARLKRVLD
jgi:hypothetical protein